MKTNQATFWNQFLAATSLKQATFGSAWSFGNTPAMADELAHLAIQGIKTATASALIEYELEQESLPKVTSDQFDILLNGAGEPVAIIQTTNVYVTTFDQVTAEHAFKEGEGDRTLTYWRAVHQKFWSESFAQRNLSIEIATMQVVCEELKIIWKPA